MRRLKRRLGPRAAHPVSPLLRHVSKAHLYPSDGLLRLGTAYGGWIIPAEPRLTAGSICYCAGAGEDISFDCALATKFQCRVRIIDPTPRAIRHFQALSEAVAQSRPFPINNSADSFYAISAENLGRLTFLPVGLADQDGELKFYMPRDPAHVSCSAVNLQGTDTYFVAPCRRLSDIMAQNADPAIDLLKIDIEGAEYMVLRDIVRSNLVPRLLLVEFDEAHTPLDDGANDRIGEHIRMLLGAGLRCIAVEGSNATFVRAS